MVIVRVAEGALEGELIQNEYGGEYYSFKGIPYAEPPVAELRFKAPQAAKPWDGVRIAKEFGPVCFQLNQLTNATIGSEDCLYLNIYSPDVKPLKPLPVMVWIHGGGFSSGSGNDDMYGPEFLVRHGVILITINYRLHILGYLSLDTAGVPGNAGMKDQVAALRWVKKNIRNFGGDPGNITIFGESAGATSVSWHLVSPMSKGLFKRAIVQSGAATCWWAKQFEPRERALAIARKLGFKSENDKELYEFFKSQPVQSFIDTKAPINYTESTKQGLDIHFSVVNEMKFGNNERFFYGDVFEALRIGIHPGVEVMAGYCEHEGYIQTMVCNNKKLITEANEFYETFVPKQIAQNCSLMDQMEVGRQLKKFYFDGQNVTNENLQHLMRYFTSELFMFSMIQWHKFASKKSTAYLYKFTCKSERNIFSLMVPSGLVTQKLGIVNHGDDIGYLFPMKNLSKKIDRDSKAYKMSDNVLKLWTNFSKYGNPTPDNSLGVKWLPYNQQRQAYLDIGEELVAGSSPDRAEYDFWEDIFKKYLPRVVPNKS